MDVPVVAISARTQRQFSNLLNPQKLVPSTQGFPRDWRGFAQLCGLTNDNFLQNLDPTKAILSEMKERNFKIDQVIEILMKIERFDILEEIRDCLARDAESFSRGNKTNADNEEVNHNILTIGDEMRIQQGLERQKYDAFLLYAEQDASFAEEVIKNLEEQNGLMLCLKDRDLIAGIDSEHEAIMRLISERCHRLIVIMSPDFTMSPHNKFFINYAQALGIDKGLERKIIPCLYKPCELPPQISYMSKLYYSQTNPKFFWDKLIGSVRTPTVRAQNIPKSVPAITVSEVVEPEVEKLLEEVNTPIKKETKKTTKIFSWKRNRTPSPRSTDNAPLQLPSLDGLDPLTTGPEKKSKKKIIKKIMEKALMASKK